MFNPVLGTVELQMGTPEAQCCTLLWLPAPGSSGFGCRSTSCECLDHLSETSGLWLKSTQLIRLAARDLRSPAMGKGAKNTPSSSISSPWLPSCLYFLDGNHWEQMLFEPSNQNDLVGVIRFIITSAPTQWRVLSITDADVLQCSKQIQIWDVFTIITLCWLACLLEKHSGKQGRKRGRECFSQSSEEKYSRVSLLVF